ncbi:hypothetical protein NLI96_g1087 [Meripilus lineatus]|uniref:GPI mannosyltransferase 2 n=1 Tax=Meripilus lineatus TaxID=2056292 RepID=A0AAD5YLD6_9APHY|nr:hypothetical protein NLI96_g1087 [Physisporinus lineatus]
MTHSPKANQGERNDVLLGMPSSDTVKRHLSSLRLFQFSSWALSLLLVYLASYLPQFDSSPEVIANLTPTDTTSDNLLLHALQRLPLLRWDAFYFGHIALRGYVYEQEWAFFPGISFVMRNSARLWNLIFARDLSAPLTWNGVLIGGFAATCFTQTAPTLYHLTLHHLGSPSAAYLTALLSLLSSSPATLRLVAYTEPFFTFFSYKGMLYCAKSQWFLASLSFALAGTFRSNGFMLGGFILYGLLIEPVLYRKRLPISHIIRAILYTSITFVPFISHQYNAYIAFCTQTSSPAPWCNNFPPFIYTYVQSKYWNVGFLRYWTLSQLPNFLMSAPVLVLLLYFSSYHILHTFVPQLIRLTSNVNLKKPSQKQTSRPKIHKVPSSPFLTPNLTPHAIHAFILTSALLFSAHTQIILRVAASMPFTYWAAAYLVVEKPFWGRLWVGWSLVWGAVSLVLWTTFLPPA